MIRVRAPQDLGAAFIFFSVGIAGLYFGSNLSGIRPGGQLGSGTMPRILSWICVAFGVLMSIKAFKTDGQVMARVPWRAVAAVSLAVIAFGFMIERVGYLPSAVAIPLIATLAMPKPRWGEAFLVAALLGIGTTLLFVVLLGQPLKIWGSAL